MIDGLHFDVTAKEMSEHLGKKVRHHSERAEFYRQQAKALEGGGAKAMQYSGGDPIKALQDKATEHTNRLEFFGFLCDHLIPGETYRLTESDLAKLEFISKGYGW